MNEKTVNYWYSENRKNLMFKHMSVFPTIHGKEYTDVFPIDREPYKNFTDWYLIATDIEPAYNRNTTLGELRSPEQWRIK